MNFLDPNDDDFYYGDVVKLIKVTVRPYTKYLAEKYGGKWKYHRKSGTWECNDGIRYIREVHIGGYDTVGGWAAPATRYLYYKDGRPTEVVN